VWTSAPAGVPPPEATTSLGLCAPAGSTFD
jgi:hypothetical protein